MNVSLRGLRKGLRNRLRRKSLPVLLVPITRGPLHNFFHFFFGYFVPLYWQRMREPESPMAVVAVAPHNEWLDLLPGNPLKRLDPLKAMKHSYLSRKSGYSPDYRVEGIFGWDKWEKFPARPLQEIAGEIRRIIGNQPVSSMDGEPADILVLLRNHQPRFFLENSGLPYGATKRDIPNLEELVSELEGSYPTKAVDPGSLAPREVISLFSRAKLVVGQHGAGLTNCFFLPPGASVIEICWPELSASDYAPIYGLLAESLGVRYQQLVIQDSAFSEIDFAELVEVIAQEMG